TRPIGGTIVRRAIAALSGVALPRRGPAHVGPLGIGRARGARPGAELGDVADTGRIAARDRRGLEGVGRTVVVRAVAALGDVAGARRRPADTRLLHVRGAGRVGAGAGLGHVARAGRRTTRGACGLEPIGRTGVVAPVAALDDVARPRRRAADAGLLRIRGAGRVGAGAALGDVADACRRATLGARGLEAVRRARVVRPVAALGDVARTRRRTADVAVLLHVGGAGDVGAVARLGDVAGPRGGAADRAGGLDAVGGTRVVRAVAPLFGVARSDRRAADVGLLGIDRA